ncbi:MAG: putative amino acid permease, GabP family [Ktedonobacterales bacterium]|jgi:amino acid transporter|nr:MAG: putative amino acid permease, GabP family [Ktedonobacterales bacterium]
MTDVSPPTAVAESPAVSASGMLRSNTLGLRHAIVISVAVMSPAASIFFNTIPQAGLAGAAIPLCYVIGFIVALLVANQYSELSRELPSSGSAYTFVTEGLGPRWGFLTGWIGLIAVALGAPYSFILMSANLQTLMYRWFGISLHWSVYFVAAIGIVFALCYLGIRQSLTIDLGFLAFEIGVCLLLAALVLFHVGGQGGLSAAPFNPASVPPGGDLTIGIVLAVLSFIGFETAATLGEETRNPHRNIPRAVFGSMIVVGLFYILMAYVATTGYGPGHMATGYANDPAPFDTISRKFSGGALAALIDLVGIFSFFSAALAIVNGGARILYSIGRDGLLPRWMAWTHPTRLTPAGAITALCTVGIVVGIGLGILLSPISAFAFLGTLDALFILLIYVLVNIACFRFFRRKRRAQFNWVRHGLLPLLGLLISAGIFTAAAISPGPAPLSFTPLVVGIWMALGLAVLVVMRGKFASN